MSKASNPLTYVPYNLKNETIYQHLKRNPTTHTQPVGESIYSTLQRNATHNTLSNK